MIRRIRVFWHPRSPLTIWAALAILYALAGLISPVVAQGLNFASGSSNKPIEIVADDGIEWQQDNEILIATGNAKASRDGITVTAQVLRAYYRKKAGGGADLYRLDAAGGVRIFSATDTITGQSAVYDFEKAILLVNGKNVVYKTGNDIISATRQMEYWERKQMAIARGNATAVHEGKKVRADTLTALMRKGKKGKSEVHTIEAFNNVIILTEEDRARADKGIYTIDNGLALLSGNVKITRENNILTGDQAEINLNTGISRLLRKKQRIRGIIYPTKK